jgi:glutaredoxin
MRLVGQWLILSLVLLGFACRHKPKEDATSIVEQTRIELTDTTQDVLLTWIDDSGDFHVTQSIADIKDANRGQVRVAFTAKETLNPDQVFVADLRQKDAKGAYAVRPMPRSAWEELGASHRKSRLEALSAPAATAPDAGQNAADVVAVIYGAEWCKACHDTAHYLSTKGVKYVEKDVDKSGVIQAELQAKFARSHTPPTSSIPVTDINGRLIVGFNPAALDSAIAAAHGSRSL